MLLKDKRMPSYPLLVKDPYFSFWMPSDDPTACDVAFWHGEKKPIRGLLTVDGTTYRFLGTGDEKPLTLTATEVDAFSTVYTFAGDGFALRVEFLSPLPPDDLDVLSLPVTFVAYEYIGKKAADVKLVLQMEERAAFDTCFNDERTEPTRANRFVLKNCECASIGLVRQLPLSTSFDENGADWGYYYLGGDRAGAFEKANRKWIYAENEHKNVKSARGFFTVAFDDIISIFYFGEYLKNYWQRDGKTIFDAIEFATASFAKIKDKCAAFDKKLIELAADYSEDYLFVLYASLRQSVGAHKLVEDGKGRILFLSKECNSDGCIATVDISYPSMPMYLLFNPELVKGMMYPILDFSRMPIWKFGFAPHDAGIYPYCIGQYYAVKSVDENSCCDIAVHDWKKNELLPFYYQFPVDHDIYVFDRQMPVEESGNMLVMSWLYYAVTGDKKFLNDNYDLLCEWVKYLEEFGLIPSNQLCTDDFAGHLDKNANLAIKAIEGIYCFSRIARAVGKKREFERFDALAKDYASKWCELYNDGDHTVLTLGNESSYSIKYNMAVDELMDRALFSSELKKRELDYYDTKATRYGVPLDSRNTIAKTDWLMWVSALGDDRTCDKYARYLTAFMTETPDRVPFSDYIETVAPTYVTFRNRTVQGGNFFPLLKKHWRKICKAK